MARQPAWFKRMARTTAFLSRIQEIVKEWPTDGSSTSDCEMDIEDAFESWQRDMNFLEAAERERR